LYGDKVLDCVVDEGDQKTVDLFLRPAGMDEEASVEGLKEEEKGEDVVPEAKGVGEEGEKEKERGRIEDEL
ncbi:hypothetical protein HK102_007299, partial [Quaeritorhiza haematococci]